MLALLVMGGGQDCIGMAQTAWRREESNLTRAAEFCVCMGATDSVAFEAELKKVVWGSYL